MSASSHWRRFVSACSGASSTHGQPRIGHLLRKPPAEWQRYSVLLRTCPVARMALLDYLTPLFVDYFVTWWQHNAQSDRPARVMDASSELLEDFYTAESMLCNLVQLLRELVTSPNASEQFVSTVCAWCLARLRPICMVPPTQLLAQLRRILQSAATVSTRSRSSASSSRRGSTYSRDSTRTKADVSRRSTKPTLDALTRVREGSPFNDGPGALQRSLPPSPSDSELTSDTEEDEDDEDDDQEEEGDNDGDDERNSALGPPPPPPPPSVAAVATSNDSAGKDSASAVASASVTKDAKSLLDFNPDSSANKQLLGAWSRCPLLMDMLHLTYELLLGSCSRLSTVQALLASATIPVPPELTSVAGYHPPPTAVLPHWVITWLTYQSYRLMHAGLRDSICLLVRSVLESATQPPPPMPSVQATSTMPADTVAGWYEEQKVDFHFWISSCLTHLLFLGDETPQLVYQWLVEQLGGIANKSDTDCSSPINSSLSGGLIHVLLRLGLATVPVPPSVPTVLEPGTAPQPGPPTTAIATSVANAAVPPATTAPFIPPPVSSNPALRFPSPINYSGFPPLPSDPFGVGPGGVMQPTPGGAMPPYYPQSMRRPNAGTASATPFPLSTPPPRAIFGAGQPLARGPPNIPIVPPPSFLPNMSQPARLSTHRPRRQGVRVDQTHGPVPTPATEWTVCTPTRQPASLVWLLNLAKLLRVASVTAIAHVLSSLTRNSSRSTDIERILVHAIDVRQLSTESPILFQLATEILLTAPAGPGYTKLLTFLFETVTGPRSEAAPLSEPEQASSPPSGLQLICSRLLHCSAVACLSMVHSSSESADSLNRGGCEGFLRAARQFAYPPCSCSITATIHNTSASLLFDLMTGSNRPISLIAAQILVALTLTLEPNLAQDILFELCCCCTKDRFRDASHTDSDEKNSVSSQTTPLLLFFPILDELETGWTARRVPVLDQPTDVPKAVSELLPWTFDDPIIYQPTTAGAYLVHEMLTFQVLPRLWDLVSCASDQRTVIPVLQALLWLLRREEALVKNSLARPRLQMALKSQLKPLLVLLGSQLHFTESTDLLLKLFEFAIGAQKVGLMTTGTGETGRAPVRYDCRHLSPRLAYQMGQRLVHVAAKLLDRMHHNTDASEVARMARLLERIERLVLLPAQSDLYGGVCGGALVRSTALRSLATTETMKLVDQAYENEAELASSHMRNRLRDLDEKLTDIQCIQSLSDRSLLSQSPNCLVLFNPPATVHGTTDDDLSSGYLRKPALSRLNRSGSLSSHQFSSGTATSNVHSAPISHCPSDRTQSQVPVSSPNWLHWLRFAKRLCSNCQSSRSNRSQSYQSGVYADWLAVALQQSLLPHGLHLPQTSVWQLPEQIPLVLSPTGIGLERVIRLMHQFCPQVKSKAAGRPTEIGTDIRAYEAVWLSQSLFGTPLALLVAERLAYCSGLVNASENTNCGKTKSTQSVLLLDPLCLRDPDQWPSVRFPYPRLLLGLLQGLEVAWASPLAPRISIPDAVAFLTAHDGIYAQGVFPVIGAPELRSFHARKLAVDYCQRRVDCRTDLFLFTKHVLMALFVICHAQDCSTVSRSSSNANHGDTVRNPPYLPLDRLLYCLNPREMSILLSDVRRNLRLRLAFEWLRSNQKWGRLAATHPVSVIASKTLDALGAGPVPPAPAFITPGLLLALLQSHLTEPGVAGLVGPLLSAVRLLQPVAESAPIASDLVDVDSVVEEVDVNGELMVVLNE